MSTSFEQGINTLKQVIDAPIAAYFSSCTNCGLCSRACIFYTETENPKYTPIRRVEPMRRIWEQEFTLVGKAKKALGLSKEVTEQDLKDCVELAFESCTTCGRCSMVCPVGNDIVYMIRRMREGLTAAGLAPKSLQDAAVRTMEKGSVMGFPMKTLEAMVKAAEKETGIEINIDKPDVDYLLLLSSAEVMQFNEIIASLAQIFKEAGVSWTFSSIAHEAGNPGMHMGASEIEAQMINRIVQAAEELNIKNVISPECGHAYMAIRWEGPNVIGRPYPFKVYHIIEVLDKLREQGKLKTTGCELERITFHDPCQAARRGGVNQPQRNLLNMVSSNFIEMKDSQACNWCCGGGGGVNTIEKAEPLMKKVFNRKRNQIEELDVTTVVTMCATCRNTLEEGIENNNMNVQVLGLTELVANHLLKEKKS
ncbi:MAG: (Fe-S)-binding protein [Gammaproteobacteria bacterium]|jgi:Fe-S oxidoreductase|nr:(Fe-S)-binding protein [Gammaproteobacteria bacterium]MBT3724892.1 (Fe-S)-binding protein [Gammaproteobacteria bacterium]MBT4192968.1 (Fe-S)-binding protein [Gammaproteobacteria bacterium]MBT4450881.1 (Fe-S)-binding protein [Gammaproteobacteria bacterium]MBT4859676.1 (Fe-S)-binding protein [Gammaproteobacteria bacterium]